jgi:hypothetical protein
MRGVSEECCCSHHFAGPKGDDDNFGHNVTEDNEKSEIKMKEEVVVVVSAECRCRRGRYISWMLLGGVRCSDGDGQGTDDVQRMMMMMVKGV